MKDKPVRIALGVVGIACFICAIALQMGIGQNTAQGLDFQEIGLAKQIIEAQKSQAQSLKEIASTLKDIKKKCGK